MKILTLLLLTSVLAWAEEKPTVEVYMIRKFVNTVGSNEIPEVILEIANTTKETLYIAGNGITYPIHYTEAMREGKWLRIPNFVSGTGRSVYPLRPGTKMLVTVDYPWEEKNLRYRFFFWHTPKLAYVMSVSSRPILREELGNPAGTTAELNPTQKLEPLETDEELNKPGSSLEATGIAPAEAPKAK
jgi:hypothetical protein